MPARKGVRVRKLVSFSWFSPLCWSELRSSVHVPRQPAAARPRELSRFAIVAQRPFDRYSVEATVHCSVRVTSDQKDYFLIPGDAMSLFRNGSAVTIFCGNEIPQQRGEPTLFIGAGHLIVGSLHEDRLPGARRRKSLGGIGVPPRIDDEYHTKTLLILAGLCVSGLTRAFPKCESIATLKLNSTAE